MNTADQHPEGNDAFRKQCSILEILVLMVGLAVSFGCYARSRAWAETNEYELPSLLTIRGVLHLMMAVCLGLGIIAPCLMVVGRLQKSSTVVRGYAHWIPLTVMALTWVAAILFESYSRDASFVMFMAVLRDAPFVVFVAISGGVAWYGVSGLGRRAYLRRTACWREFLGYFLSMVASIASIVGFVLSEIGW